MRLIGCGAAGVVIGALFGAVVFRTAPSPAQAAAPRAAELAPDPVTVRYRYTTARAAAPDDRPATISILAARITSEHSPFEMAELAELYFRRAQEGGDRRDYDLAQALAERSLAGLRQPNPAL